MGQFVPVALFVASSTLAACASSSSMGVGYVYRVSVERELAGGCDAASGTPAELVPTTYFVVRVPRFPKLARACSTLEECDRIARAGTAADAGGLTSWTLPLSTFSINGLCGGNASLTETTGIGTATITIRTRECDLVDVPAPPGGECSIEESKARARAATTCVRASEIIGELVTAIEL
jgi:hypothetical protein